MPFNMDYSDLKNTYKEGIDSLIEGVGKPLTLYFKKLAINPNEEFTDRVRGGDIRKPTFKESAPEIEYETVIIPKALIKYNPKDFDLSMVSGNTVNGKYSQLQQLRLDKENSIMRLKTYINDLAILERCEYLMPNDVVSQVVYAKYKMLRAPVPFGLGNDHYAITYWGRI